MTTGGSGPTARPHTRGRAASILARASQWLAVLLITSWWLPYELNDRALQLERQTGCLDSIFEFRSQISKTTSVGYLPNSQLNANDVTKHEILLSLGDARDALIIRCDRLRREGKPVLNINESPLRRPTAASNLNRSDLDRIEYWTREALTEVYNFNPPPWPAILQGKLWF